MDISLPTYIVKSNTDEEIKILEIDNYIRNFSRELTIKKDKAIIITWLNALGDKELLDIHNFVKDIMKERGINAK